MKILEYILTLSLFLAISVSANPNFVVASNMHKDGRNKLISPDKWFMNTGITSYRKGYYQSAFSNFKKAAAMGNSLAQRYIGLMYLNALGVEKDFVKGYVWLKLATRDKTKKSIELEKLVFKLLNNEQIKQAQIDYDLVNENYGEIAVPARRDRWVRKQKTKMTGTRTGSLVFAPVKYDTPHGNGFFNSVKGYVDDYNSGYVSSGEIIPVEESSEKQKE